MKPNAIVSSSVHLNNIDIINQPNKVKPSLHLSQLEWLILVDSLPLLFSSAQSWIERFTVSIFRSLLLRWDVYHF